MGDSSDNIPGVPGVGPKTARELLLRFGSHGRRCTRHLDDPSIRPKLREKLEAGRESAELSYDLATIRCNAPIDFTPQEAMLQEPNKKELYDLFVKLEFVKLIDRYRPAGGGCRSRQPQQVAVQLPHRQELPEAGTPCALVLGEDGAVAVAWAEGVCAVPPLEREGRLEALLGPETPKICHDLKTCLHDLEALGLPQAGFRFDTALAAYDLNPSQGGLPPDQGGHGLPGPDAGGPGGPGVPPCGSCSGVPGAEAAGAGDGEPVSGNRAAPVRHPVPHGAGGSGCGPE